jgi:hypothetical protein
MDGETARQIARDVALGIPPSESKIRYGPEESKFRKQIERERAEILKKDPDAAFDERD